jgi:hypothetical protein
MHGFGGVHGPVVVAVVLKVVEDIDVVTDDAVLVVVVSAVVTLTVNEAVAESPAPALV